MDGPEVTIGQVGELLLRGSLLLQSYWNDLEEAGTILTKDLRKMVS